MGIASTILLGGLAFWWGIRFGRLLLRKGATANDLFKGKTSVSLAFLGIYIALLLLALYVPQWQWLPLAWRVSGMQVSWAAMRIILLGICGVAFVVSWHTRRLQVIAVVLIGLIGLGSFTAAEAYLLAPIYSTLDDNLRPNGVFQQTATSSCAPAAMATVLRRWGLDETESSVAKLAGTSRLGTSMPQLITAAHQLQMDGLEITGATWEQMQRINRPGVLASWLFNPSGRRSPHAIALLSLSDDTATIADPAWGRIYRLNRQQFQRIWRREYVPFFRPEEVVLSAAQVRDYLTRLGYLNPSSAIANDIIDHATNHATNNATINTALRRFQQSVGLSVTGTLDAKTALMLSGPFLTEGPSLKDEIQG
ncbi:MAG: peptidoglycan-binding protein [Thermoleptolyngbya sp. C42_A2020_037]|nr:peptidoglycan-binding protein [Thermoleptolyngbya sp. C42_A2020_037]